MNRLVVLLIFILGGCTNIKEKKTDDFNELKETTIMRYNIDSIKIKLKSNLDELEESGGDYYFLSKEELNFEFELIYNHLLENGFKFPSDTVLNKVVDDILSSNRNNRGFIVNHDNYQTILSPKAPIIIINGVYKGNNYEFEDVYDLEVYLEFNLFINKQYKFITDLIPFPMIINAYEQEDIDIKIPNYTLHINNYLIYNSNASLTWLKNNKPTFLEDLFNVYGYTKDKRLDKWILDQRLEIREREDWIKFIQTFFYQRYDKSLKINQEVFEVFEENVSDKCMRTLSEYVYVLARAGEFEVYEGLTYEQKAEIYARLIYLGEHLAYTNEIYSRYQELFMRDFRVNIADADGRYPDLYYKIFEKNNFYNLPKFKEYWDATNEVVLQTMNYKIEHSDKG